MAKFIKKAGKIEVKDKPKKPKAAKGKSYTGKSH